MPDVKDIVIKTSVLAVIVATSCFLIGWMIVGIDLLAVGYARKTDYRNSIKDEDKAYMNRKTNCTVVIPRLGCDENGYCRATVNYLNRLNVTTNTVFRLDTIYATYKTGSEHDCYYDPEKPSKVSYFEGSTIDGWKSSWRGRIGVGWSVLFGGLILTIIVITAVAVTALVIRLRQDYYLQQDHESK